MKNTTAAALLLVAGCAAPASHGVPDMPPTPKRPVVDRYHGVEVVDDYRWLEDAADPEVRAWSDAQNARARAVLDHLPSVEALRLQVTALMKTQTVSYRGVRARGGTLFAMKHQPPRQQPFLVAMPAPDDLSKERVVLDPVALDAKGTTTIDFYVPSLDGRLVAVSLSERGSESGTVRCYETATGREVGEPIPRVNGGTAGGSVAWNSDATGFFYTRYPRGAERPAQDMDFFQQVFFHRLGTPTETDRYEVGREFPRIAEIQLSTDDRGAYLVANVSNGDGGEHAIWVRGSDGAWKQATRFEDEVVAASIDSRGDLFMLSRRGAPRGKVIRADASAPTPDKASTVVGESDATIERFVVTDTRVYVVDQLGGPQGVRVFERGGPVGRGDYRRIGVVTLPEPSSIDEIARLGGDAVLLRTQSCVTQPQWHRAGAEVEKPLERSPLSDAATVDLSDAEVVREWATSKDGTRVPMSIVRRKGTSLDGTNPTLLSAYGGYGICMTPRYRNVLRVWLDRGGVSVVANIRGGGEFGEEWHRAGNLTKKQNVFDDFAACAARLVELGYTRPEKLALEGGSNGGLLMGAMIVQHPEICRAVVSHVGIYDMLRVETTPNGAFNVTEFGTVTDPEHFRALHAYSPLHNVVDGAAYPAVLFMTGANDPRVDPYNSRKMTARLQAATSSDRPIVLRTSANSGHGMGSSLDERVEQEVDKYAFLFHELGIDGARP
jgi:prolyl oligopeptidase